MNLVLPLLGVLALVAGVVATALSLYNFFRMSQEIRAKAEGWVNLIPYIAFALPGALTPAGAAYRSRGTRWVLVAGVCVAVVAGARFLGDR